MPRRISDYADAFAGWNLVSSFGSLISVIATWLFLYILYVQLVEGKATSRYPWLTPQFYFDTLQTHLTRAFNSIEWGLNSPPKPHAFASLPLQSDLFKSITGRIGAICLTFSLLIPLAINFGLCLGYKIPTQFMLAQLNLLQIYPLFNVVIVLCSVLILANLKDKPVKPIQLYLSVFFALFVPFLILFAGGNYNQLITSLHYLFAHLPLVRFDLKDMWSMLVGNRITMSPPYDSVSNFRLPADPIKGAGGAGESTGASGGSGSGSGSGSKQASASRPQASSSGDNTYMVPEAVQYKLDSISTESNELLQDPAMLSQGMDSNLSAFRIIDNLSNKVRTEIIREAESLSPVMQEVHHQLPKKKSLLDYWNYKIVNVKAIKQVKIVELLEEKGYVTSLENKIQLENHKDICNGIRNASYYSMQNIYSNDFNSRDRKFIRRHMVDFVTGDTSSD